MPLRLPAIAAIAAATATTTTPTAATATAAAATLGAGLGFVDAEGASVEERAVHRLDGGLRLLIRRHGYEGEAARAARLAVHDEVHVGDFAELGKCRTDRVRRSVERK